MSGEKGRGKPGAAEGIKRRDPARRIRNYRRGPVRQSRNRKGQMTAEAQRRMRGRCLSGEPISSGI